MTWVRMDVDGAQGAIRRMVEQYTRMRDEILHLVALENSPGLGGSRGEISGALTASAEATLRGMIRVGEQFVDLATRWRKFVDAGAAPAALGAAAVGANLPSVGSATPIIARSAFDAVAKYTQLVGASQVPAGGQDSNYVYVAGDNGMYTRIPRGLLGREGETGPGYRTVSISGLGWLRVANAGAASAGGGGTALSRAQATDPLAASMASKAYSNVLSSMGSGTALILAPSGSRLASSSPGYGYTSSGTYGNNSIWVPTRAEQRRLGFS